MLLKCSQTEKRSKTNVNTKQQRGTGNMKLTVGTAVTPRLHRKVVKGFGSKRPLVQPRIFPEEQLVPVDPCDNSNDSGLGFDQHVEPAVAARFPDQQPLWLTDFPEVKRKKLEIKLESDNANDHFGFPPTMNRLRKDSSETGGSENAHPNVLRAVERRGPDILPPGRSAPLQRPVATLQRSQMRPQPRSVSAMMRRPTATASLTSQLTLTSRDGKAHLQIVCQPEQQHRARYQTEGSRGAVKDRTGNGFPVVKLVGYNKPATLQVFIGTDVGRVAPHMFYQACRVSGKNSTPCVEKRIDGTVVIEVNFDPAKDMTITCDCVGILKERNVDVEHRFPEQTGSRNKKKSTRCRMVFRTTVTNPDGSTEILQITSQPIVCTQPPGIPEICKKSLVSCPCTGGMELFILGKNFLKDTRVIFQQNDLDPVWEEPVQPDKEFLQQTHLVCTVPPYRRCDLMEPVVVKLFVVSSGKMSEPHTFTYTPANNPLLRPAVGSTDIAQPCLTLPQAAVPSADLGRVFVPAAGLMVPKPGLQGQFEQAQSVDDKKNIHPVRLWASSKVEDKRPTDNEPSAVVGHKMMPPPPALLPIAVRRVSSTRLIIPDTDHTAVTEGLKTEVIEEGTEDIKVIDLRMKPVATVSDLSSTQSPSMATFRQFVSSSTDSPLPTQSGLSVENYLSRLEKTTNKMQNVVAVTNASSSLMFPASVTQQKPPFAGDTSLPSVFPSASSVGMEKEKASYDQSATLQEAIAASFVADLNSGRSETQQKPGYDSTSPAVLAFPSMSESQFQSSPATLLFSNTGESMGAVPHKSGDQSPIATQPTDSMSLEVASGGVNHHLLSEPALMSVPSSSRLEELVSSAIENHILASDHQSQVVVTQKLNALVNCAAESHMMTQCSIPISSESTVLSSQTSDASQQPSPVYRLESSSQQPVPISISSALNEHFLNNTQSLEMNGQHVAVDDVLLRSPTSPITMKTIILNSEVSPSIDKQIIVQSPSCTSPITGKNMILGPALDLHNSDCTTIANSTPGDQNIQVAPSVAVKNILNSSPVNSDTHLSNSNSTSPIPGKNLILQSSTSLVATNTSENSSASIAAILNSDSSLLASTETSSALISEHMLASSSNDSSSPVLSTLLASSSVPTLLADGPALQQVPLVITQAPSVPSSSSATSITSVSTQRVEEAPSTQSSLQQHLTSMFAVSNVESSVQVVNFTPESNSLQPSVHQGDHLTLQPSLHQGEHLASTTADSSSGNILTNVCISELNAENQNSGSATFVNQMLMDLAANGPMKPSISLAASIKVSEHEIFDASCSLKPTGSKLIPVASKLNVPAASSASSTLPVPVAEISNAIQTSKATPAANSPIVQKKCEEGMVPQELTQMSEHDLLSYINPSCFDQVL